MKIRLEIMFQKLTIIRLSGGQLNRCPPAKYISAGESLVCPDLPARFLVGTQCLSNWRGKNPDHPADMIRKWRTWEIVFEGML